MRVSIFTPTHNPKYLLDVYNSIKDQQFYEWVILHNNNSQHIEINDERVKQISTDISVDAVGIYKKMACNACSGDILLELDHDDLLLPSAISEVIKAFQDEKVGFVYSNVIRVNVGWQKTERFNSLHGWKFREVKVNGEHDLDEIISFAPTPASISRIWYAPDHLRAFRKSVYNKVGGYDPKLKVLDDQDLMCRMYLESEFYHIDKPLYVYQIYGQNSWLKYNKEIQDGVYPLYHKYIEPMALKWADRKYLRKLDLGGRLNHDKRYEAVDLRDVEVIADLNDSWPFEDNSVGVIRANDVFEHLFNPIHVMEELSRVLAPGGYAFIQVPSTDGRGAFQDPTHVSFWNENSFLYYTNKQWSKYIDTPVKFQAMRLFTTQKNEQQVCWTVAHLVNLKDGFIPPGVINF
jgi:O-antigen biosynthesis protein